MMLGDLGADVIKVERPGTGDDTRGWGGPTDSRGRGAYFLSINRNKLSVVADLDSADDRDLIRSLIAGADVVVDNFLPDMLRTRGIEPDKIVRESPRLVWCTITGFGAGNPRPGYDFITQAESGWMAITGEPGGDPMKVGVALADVVAGKDAAIAILAALAGRANGRTLNRRLVISLMDSARGALVNVAQGAAMSGTEPRRWGNAHPNIVPYQLFHASDRPIVVAVGTDRQWASCAAALGLDQLSGVLDLSANHDRLSNRDLLVHRIQEVMSTRTAGEWLKRLDAAGVPAGVVKTVLQSLEATEASPTMGMPSSVGGVARREPPTLDEHGPAVRRSGWRAFDG